MTLDELRTWHADRALRHFSLVTRMNRCQSQKHLLGSMNGEFKAAETHLNAVICLNRALGYFDEGRERGIYSERERAAVAIRNQEHYVAQLHSRKTRFGREIS